MKYLTKKRWAGTRGGEQANAGGADAASWGKALRAYRGQLEAMRPRLTEHVFAFFDRADIHEGELLHLDIRDGRQPVPGDHPVRMELAILDAYDKLVWTLQYRSIRRIL